MLHAGLAGCGGPGTRLGGREGLGRQAATLVDLVRHEVLVAIGAFLLRLRLFLLIGGDDAVAAALIDRIFVVGRLGVWIDSDDAVVQVIDGIDSARLLLLVPEARAGRRIATVPLRGQRLAFIGALKVFLVVFGRHGALAQVGAD